MNRAPEYKFETVNSPEEFRRIVTQRGEEGWEFVGSADFTANVGRGGGGGPAGLRSSTELVFRRRGPPAGMASGGMMMGGMGGLGQGFGGGGPGASGGGSGFGGGGTGAFGGGGFGTLGGGGGTTVPEAMINNNFKRLIDETGGGDTINLAKLHAETRERYAEMAKRAGIDPLPESGKWTSKQFADWYTKYTDGMRRNRPSRGGPGGDAGPPGPRGGPPSGGGGGAPVGGLPRGSGGGELTTFQLKNASADQVAKLLSNFLGESPTFRVVADPRTNTLILSASDAEQAKVRALIEVLDGPANPRRAP
jgi:hypothetical protein